MEETKLVQSCVRWIYPIQLCWQFLKIKKGSSWSSSNTTLLLKVGSIRIETIQQWTYSIMIKKNLGSQKTNWQKTLLNWYPLIYTYWHKYASKTWKNYSSVKDMSSVEGVCSKASILDCISFCQVVLKAWSITSSCSLKGFFLFTTCGCNVCISSASWQ